MQNISTFVVLIKMMFYDQIRKEVNLKINAMSTLLILFIHIRAGVLVSIDSQMSCLILVLKKKLKWFKVLVHPKAAYM